MRCRASASAVLLVGLVACDDGRYPWEVPGDAPVTHAGRSLPAASASVEEPPAAPPSTLFARCAAGFVPSADPLRDATRLGLACGPSTGMARLGEVREGAVAEGTAITLPLRLEAGACYRVFAVADEQVAELDASIVSSRGTVLASDHAEGRVAIVQPDRPACATATDDASVRVEARSGRGRAAVALWWVEGGTNH